jgi:hypothetical protein
MSTMSCIELSQVADELALDVLPGDVRALALQHLDDCPSCRALVEGLSETADELLFAHGGLEPPAGFEDRVMARLGAEPTALRRPRRRLPILAAAAAILVAALVGVGAVALRAGSHRGPVAAAEVDERHAPLIAPSGAAVGDASAYAGRQAWFFMRVNQGVAPGTYECVLDVTGGRTIRVGTLTVTGGKGAWGENLTVPASSIRDARLVTSHGGTIATAVLQ